MQVNWIPFAERWPPINELLWVGWDNSTADNTPRLAICESEEGFLHIEYERDESSDSELFHGKFSSWGCYPDEIFEGAPTHWALFERPDGPTIKEG